MKKKQQGESVYLAFHIKVLSALILKYPLKQYCDDWTENVNNFLKNHLEEHGFKLLECISESEPQKHHARLHHQPTLYDQIVGCLKSTNIINE